MTTHKHIELYTEKSNRGNLTRVECSLDEPSKEMPMEYMIGFLEKLGLFDGIFEESCQEKTLETKENIR